MYRQRYAPSSLCVASRRHSRRGLQTPAFKPENPTYYQEFFAFVALIFRVKNEAEAVKLANDSLYGLGGSIMTSSLERGRRVARQIETDMVFSNRATWTAPDLRRTMILKIARVRDVLGLSAMLNDFPYEIAAEPLGPCGFKYVSKAPFQGFLEAHVL